VDASGSLGYFRGVFTISSRHVPPFAIFRLKISLRSRARRRRLRVGAEGTVALMGARRLLLRSLAPALALLLGACATTPSPPSARLANDVLFRAIGLVGTPYHWGGNTPESGFDCSGLVDYVFRTAAGVVLPRESGEIADVDGPRISADRLQPGDLLFFGKHRRVSHVAIYVGNGRFVHAPNTGGTVRLDKLDGDYWRSHFLYAKRVLEGGATDSAAVAAN
jgi:hypothetical protein